MKNKGFSLVELIVVIAIMAILVGVAVPVYSSYIEKTQKSKDEQMIDEIKHAIEIAAVGDSWYQEIPGGGAVGTIVISDNGTTVSGDHAALITKALTDTFGDLSSLKLSYDGWTGTLSADGVTILTNSAYKDVDGLMSTVQDITDLFAEYVDGAGNGVTFDEEFFGSLGIDVTNPETLDATQVANGMVVFIADQTQTIDPVAFENAWALDAGPNFDNVEGLDLFGKKAAEYAYVQALVERFGCTNPAGTFKAAFDAYNTNYVGASPYANVFGAHIAGCSECQAKAESVVTKDNLRADAKAYLKLLGQVSSSRDLVVENIGNDKLYEDSSLVQYVESYVSVAELLSSSGASDGDVVIVAVMDANGRLTLNVYPLDY